MALDCTVHQMAMNEGLFTWSRCSSALAVYSGKQKPLRWIWVSVSMWWLFWDWILSAFWRSTTYLCVYTLKPLMKIKSSATGMLITNILRLFFSRCPLINYQSICMPRQWQMLPSQKQVPFPACPLLQSLSAGAKRIKPVPSNWWTSTSFLDMYHTKTNHLAGFFKLVSSSH